MIIFDKAKYHYDGDYPDDIDHSGAYTMTGLYIAWCAFSSLLSEWTIKNFPTEINDLLSKKTNPATLYKSLDGTLTNKHLNRQGVEFSKIYFDFDHGAFLDDLIELLAEDLPTIYHIPDTWDSFNTIKPRIDLRYAEWLKTKGG